MRSPKFPVMGLAAAALVAGVALGSELPRSITDVAHAMRNTAGSKLINDPRYAPILSGSAQHALQSLRTADNSLSAPPLSRAVPRAGAAPTSAATWITPNPPLAFNNDQSGFPQNTESLTSCNGGRTLVGTFDDYRLSASNGDFSAWSISTNSGSSLTNTNFLPGITVNATVSGPASGPSPKAAGGGPASGPAGNVYVSTQGAPMVRATQGCSVYATSLIFGYSGPFVDGVVLDGSDAGTLATCSSEKACWPKRRGIVVDITGSAFFDKPAVAVDPTGTYVWVAYSAFRFDEYGNNTNSLEAVRCSADLAHCTKPRTLESNTQGFYGGGFQSPTWASIGIGSDGSTHVSWADVQGGFGAQAAMQIREATAPPGSTAFGGPVTVTQVDSPVLITLAGEPFRAGGFPELAVSHAGGVDRLHIVWAQCRNTVYGVCERATVMLATSRTGAAGTWSVVSVSPGTASDFFPAVTTNTATGNLLVGFITNRFDPAQHDFDVLAVPVNAATGAQSPAVRLTATSIEPSNDSYLGGYTIGDYWELTAVAGTAWGHYTSTQRLQRLLGQGVPIPQQDNVLDRFTY